MMGDGQECQICRRSHARCECSALFKVTGYLQDGSESGCDCNTRSEVWEVISYMARRESCVRFRIDKHTDKGYVMEWEDSEYAEHLRQQQYEDEREPHIEVAGVWPYVNFGGMWIAPTEFLLPANVQEEIRREVVEQGRESGVYEASNGKTYKW